MAGGKKFYRCNVCSDVHYGLNPPSPCPTCGSINAYVEITAEEAAALMELKK